jgi:outer membrane murein-binding lipoprotein Lpp
MKKNDMLIIAVIVIVATVFSSIVAGKIFNSTKKHNLTAPDVQTIDSNFPDIKNDTAYSSFLNSQALDPTQLIQIGTNQNSSSFSGQ